LPVEPVLQAGQGVAEAEPPGRGGGLLDGAVEGADDRGRVAVADDELAVGRLAVEPDGQGAPVPGDEDVPDAVEQAPRGRRRRATPAPGVGRPQPGEDPAEEAAGEVRQEGQAG